MYVFFLALNSLSCLMLVIIQELLKEMEENYKKKGNKQTGHLQLKNNSMASEGGEAFFLKKQVSTNSNYHNHKIIVIEMKNTSQAINLSIRMIPHHFEFTLILPNPRPTRYRKET